MSFLFLRLQLHTLQTPFLFSQWVNIISFSLFLFCFTVSVSPSLCLSLLFCTSPSPSNFLSNSLSLYIYLSHNILSFRLGPNCAAPAVPGRLWEGVAGGLQRGGEQAGRHRTHHSRQVSWGLHSGNVTQHFIDILSWRKFLRKNLTALEEENASINLSHRYLPWRKRIIFTCISSY